MTQFQRLCPLQDEAESPDVANVEPEDVIIKTAVKPTGSLRRRVPKPTESLCPLPAQSKNSWQASDSFAGIVTVFSKRVSGMFRGLLGLLSSFSTWFLGGRPPSQFLLKVIILVIAMLFVSKEWQDFKAWLATLPNLMKETTVVLYCTFIGWKCPTGPRFPVPTVVGGLIQDVGDARDVFGMIAKLGNTGLVPINDNHVQ